MKNIIVPILTIFLFSACSTYNKPMPKKVYYYDSVTEGQIETTIQKHIETLLVPDLEEKNIFVEKFKTTHMIQKNFSTKFEEYLEKVLEEQLNKYGFKTNSSEKITLSLSYTPFGKQGILINSFLMDRQSRKIVSSAKHILPIDPCEILSVNCNQSYVNQNRKISNKKRSIGLVDANCTENCNNTQKEQKTDQENSQSTDEIAIDSDRVLERKSMCDEVENGQKKSCYRNPTLMLH